MKLSLQSWNRLWLPLEKWEAAPDMGEDFLTEEGGAFATRWFTSQRVEGMTPLTAYGDLPFLLLLGRPGAGKSIELEKAHLEGTLGKSVFITGKEIGNSDPGLKIEQMIQAGFPNPGDQENVRILLDGLDEALLSKDNFVPELRHWLSLQKSKEGRPKFRLAISTRWTDWSEDEIGQLASLWPREHFQKLVLAPLKRSDVVQTLTQRYGETSAEDFWYQVITRRLQPVACWPQGLRGLMESFDASGKKRIAQSYGESIRAQVMSLCALTDNRDDRGRWNASHQGTEWRRHLAGRLAAVMFFTDRHSFRLEYSQASDSAQTLRVGDLTHTEEHWQNLLRTIVRDDLDELVARTGLLKRSGNECRWVFQSHVYQEWLAADWLNHQNLNLDKVQSLFGHEHDGLWKVYSELKAVACWLAGMNSGFRQLLVENDPLVLLGMDAGPLAEAEREKVTEAILKATDQVRTLDHRDLEQSHIGSLAHPNLDAQLRSWLDNPAVHAAAKELAAEIIQHTELKSIVPHLWELLPESKGRYRIELAHALSRLARDEASIPRWNAILNRELPLDDNGVLLAGALECLVLEKKCVPLRDVLPWVFPKHDFGMIGRYDSVCRKLHEAMQIEDVPAVFACLKKVELRDEYEEFVPSSSFNRRALELSFRNLERPETASALAGYWHHCLKRYLQPHEMIDLEWLSVAGRDALERRRHLISLLIHHPAFDEQKSRKWITSRDYLFVPDDLEWCLDEILKAENPDEAWRFALIAADYAWKADLTGALGAKFDQAYARSPFFRNLLPQPEAGKSLQQTLAEIQVNQERKSEADRAKTELRRKQQQEAFQKRLEAHKLSCKQAHEQGRMVWGDVLDMLGARKHGRGSYVVNFGLEDTVRDDEEWIREAARRYLVERPRLPKIEEVDGLNALFALAVVPQELAAEGAVKESVRVNWLPALIRSMTHSGMEKASVGLSCADLAHLFPQRFASAFGQVMRKDYREAGSIYGLRSFLSFWNLQMTEELVSLLKEESIQSRAFPTALKYLYEVAPEASLGVARFWLSRFQDQEEPSRASLLGSCALLLDGRLAGEIKGLLQEPSLVASALGLVLGIHDYMERRLDVSKWPDQAVEDLANAAWRACPNWGKRRPSGTATWLAGGVRPADLAVEFRGHITRAARDRGLHINVPLPPDNDKSEDAEELESYARWHQHQTDKRLAGAGWQPLPPDVFLKVVQIREARLARTNDELLEALLESLKRWEKRLEGGWWKRLWDIGPRQAKTEDNISDEIREWLKDDLGNVFAEREVKLLQQTRPDLLLQVADPASQTATLSVVIEVKKVREGNKRERLTAANSQLLNRYLIPKQHEGWTHGLFLVVWTPKPGSKLDNQEAKEKEALLLEEHAKANSTPPYHIASMVIDARFGGDEKTASPKKKSTAARPRKLKDGNRESK